MKFEHRIYSTPNMFGTSYHYELIGDTHWAVGQLQQTPDTKITLANFRNIRKELAKSLENA